jgi:hypothetical protein
MQYAREKVSVIFYVINYANCAWAMDYTWLISSCKQRKVGFQMQENMISILVQGSMKPTMCNGHENNQIYKIS